MNESSAITRAVTSAAPTPKAVDLDILILFLVLVRPKSPDGLTSRTASIKTKAAGSSDFGITQLDIAPEQAEQHTDRERSDHSTFRLSSPPTTAAAKA